LEGSNGCNFSQYRVVFFSWGNYFSCALFGDFSVYFWGDQLDLTRNILKTWILVKSSDGCLGKCMFSCLIYLLDDVVSWVWDYCGQDVFKVDERENLFGVYTMKYELSLCEVKKY